jgi:hypothetical protein
MSHYAQVPFLRVFTVMFAMANLLACAAEPDATGPAVVQTGNIPVKSLPIQVYSDSLGRDYVLLASVEQFNLREDSDGTEEYLRNLRRGDQSTVNATDGQVWAIVTPPGDLLDYAADYPVVPRPLSESDQSPETISYLPHVEQYCTESCSLEFRFAWGSLAELEASGQLADPNGPGWLATSFDYVPSERIGRATRTVIDERTFEMEATWGIFRVDVTSDRLAVGFETVAFRYTDDPALHSRPRTADSAERETAE